MTRRLKAVEAMPEPRVAQLLPGLPGLPSGRREAWSRATTKAA
jgi:hypothetical protein